MHPVRAGYFAKLPVAKAISETPPYVTRGQGLTAAGRFWYLLGCLAYGANYFAKVWPRRRCPTSAWPR